MKIPNRWLNYSPTGKQIPNTPFVAFKCPLSKEFFEFLPPEKRFGVEEIKSKLPQVSLIIDLTNTSKYYNPKILYDVSIEHEKISIPGRQLPSKHQLEKFFQIVDNFQKNNGSNHNKLIGIHCTHGVNRTGFFICSYMINRLRFKSENAIQEFSAARGHSIERTNYLEALKRFEKYPFRPKERLDNFQRQLPIKHPGNYRGRDKFPRPMERPNYFTSDHQHYVQMNSFRKQQPRYSQHNSHGSYESGRDRNFSDQRSTAVSLSFSTQQPPVSHLYQSYGSFKSTRDSNFSGDRSTAVPSLFSTQQPIPAPYSYHKSYGSSESRPDDNFSSHRHTTVPPFVVNQNESVYKWHERR